VRGGAGRRRSLLAARLVGSLLASAGAGALGAQPAIVPEPTDATRKVLVARRAAGPITLDGRLDEPAWGQAQVARDFSQVRNDYVPTTKYPTEARILFDDQHLYVGAFNRDSAGLGTLRMPDLRRDFSPPDNDVFQVVLGPLGDHRTALNFQVTPLGSQSDVQTFDGGDVSNFAWDALWRVRTSRADSGWTVEMAIPWASLRYRPDLTSWDVNFTRNTRRALQWSAWAPFPRQFSSWRITYAGRLDSVTPPPRRLNLRVRPYLLGQSTRDGAPRAFNGTVGDLGGEVIWAPTASSLVEATVNTDFAQAEVDRQVVNLTRFNVFFPEQRQFFLENADLLSAGGLTGSLPSGFGFNNSGGQGTQRYVLQPFFSRRIGLDPSGSPIPIVGGARYAYRSGRTSAGALLMRQDNGAPGGGTTFGVVRGSEFLGRATRVGATVAYRDDAPLATGGGRRNVVTAVDAFTRIGEQVQLSGMVSTSTVGDTTGVAASYSLSRSTPDLAVALQGALVQRAYAPQTGFVSRSHVLMTSPMALFTLQPRWRPRNIIWFRPGVTTTFFQDPSTRRLQEGIVNLNTEVLYRSGAQLKPFAEWNLQRPDAPVSLFPGVATPAGRRDYWRAGLESQTDQSAAVAATANLSTGSFFDGWLDRAALTGRWSPNPYVSLRVNYEVNRLVSLGARDSSFVTQLAGPELRLFASPRVQWSAFYQYNTAQARGFLNARFSWEFSPLSFLYVVYNDRHPIQGALAPSARSLIVKLSWLRQL
jgi:hypothetical protein